MTLDRFAPYQDLPKLPPKVEIETRKTLKAAVSASRALGELKGAGRNIPNQTVLLSVLGLQEAKLSSEIENIVTTNDDLYRAFADQSVGDIDPATKEVLRYNDALWLGLEELKKGRPLSSRFFEDLVRIVKQTDAGVRTLPGTQIINATTREVIYAPPEGAGLIRDLLRDLENFMHSDDGLDPLIKMAAIHYQFEAIHPFADGNGRVGRILNILYLVDKGLLEVPILYLSKYIIQEKNEYYTLLQGVTERHEWEQWILFMLNAVEETATDTRSRISQIRELIDTFSAEVLERAPRVYSMDLINVLFEQPYCKIKFVEEACHVTRQTASSYLHELEELGFLKGYKVGREMYYVNVPFFDLLTL